MGRALEPVREYLTFDAGLGEYTPTPTHTTHALLLFAAGSWPKVFFAYLMVFFNKYVNEIVSFLGLKKNVRTDNAWYVGHAHTRGRTYITLRTHTRTHTHHSSPHL
jgi:hypothetical protein